MMGRDDDYMPDFRYRLVTTVDFIARQLVRLDALEQAEILVADWASDTPMAETLTFSAAGARLCHFLCLQPESLRQAGHRVAVPHPAVGINVAIRRAAGEFVMQIGADTLLPLHALDYLLRLCRGDLALPVDPRAALLLIPRIHIPWQFVKRQPSVDQWERCLVANSCHAAVEQPYNLAAGGSAGAILMHRSLWHDLRGLTETLAGWGWSDSDVASRAGQSCPWLALSGYGVVSAHMEHEPGAGRRAQALAATLPVKGQTFPHALGRTTNPADWGLGTLDLPKQVARAATQPAPAAVIAPTAGFGADPATLAVLRELVTQSVGRLANERVVDASCLHELTAWFILAWWASRHYPLNVLDVGIREPAAAAVVGAACPTVEIAGVDTWDGDLEYPQTTPAIAVGLRAAGHRGHVHFLNGPAASSLERLQGVSCSLAEIELAYIRERPLGPAFAAFAGRAAQRLAPGGMLVFRAVSRAAARRAQAEIGAAARPLWVCLAPDGLTGVAIQPAAGEVLEALVSLLVTLSAGAQRVRWRDISPAIAWQAYRGLRPPYRPVYFLRRALRCLFVTGLSRPR
jgi:hypothetical protein